MRTVTTPQPGVNGQPSTTKATTTAPHRFKKQAKDRQISHIIEKGWLKVFLERRKMRVVRLHGHTMGREVRG